MIKRKMENRLENKIKRVRGELPQSHLIRSLRDQGIEISDFKRDRECDLEDKTSYKASHLMRLNLSEFDNYPHLGEFDLDARFWIDAYINRMVNPENAAEDTLTPVLKRDDHGGLEEVGIYVINDLLPHDFSSFQFMPTENGRYLFSSTFSPGEFRVNDYAGGVLRAGKAYPAKKIVDFITNYAKDPKRIFENALFGYSQKNALYDAFDSQMIKGVVEENNK